jgi:hypothetical protein
VCSLGQLSIVVRVTGAGHVHVTVKVCKEHSPGRGHGSRAGLEVEYGPPLEAEHHLLDRGMVAWSMVGRQ